MQVRQAQLKRDTKETRIAIKLNLDGSGKSSIKTGIPFFDHMLTLFAKHAVMDLNLTCKGDLEVDAHHTVEDCGIALGQAFVMALGDKKGIRRYGFGFHPKNPFTGEAYVPMDECLTRCVIDFSGRSHLVWRGNSSKDLLTKPTAICIWNSSTVTSRITSPRLCSRRLPRLPTPPVRAIPALPGNFPVPRANFSPR